jgi:hypothetical protein
MPMDSVSSENVDRMRAECDKKECELRELEEKTAGILWMQELDILETEYKIYKEERNRIGGDAVVEVKKKKIVIKVK